MLRFQGLGCRPRGAAAARFGVQCPLVWRHHELLPPLSHPALPLRRLAGLPDSVVRRAAQVAEQLEEHKSLPGATGVEAEGDEEGAAGGAQPMEVEGEADGGPAEAGGQQQQGLSGEATEVVRRAVAAARGEGGGALGADALAALQAEARRALA